MTESFTKAAESLGDLSARLLAERVALIGACLRLRLTAGRRMGSRAPTAPLGLGQCAGAGESWVNAQILWKEHSRSENSTVACLPSSTEIIGGSAIFRLRLTKHLEGNQYI